MRRALAVLLMLAVGCSPIVPPPSSYISVKRLEGLLGFALWDCDEPYPTAWVRIHLRGEDLVSFGEDGQLWVSLNLRETFKHELTHIDQQNAEGCKRWLELYRDPQFRVEKEHEAECAGRAIVGRPCNP